MSLWQRIANVFSGERLNREIDEELESHLEEAIAEGRDPEESRRAFGSPLRMREEVRDVSLVPWLDSLRSDTVFGWRQLKKHRVTSTAAILSLALAIGACTSAFRLIDALLFRPLPITHAERVHVVAFEGVGADGKSATYDSSSYPMFQRMRAAAKDDAELVAVSYTDRMDLTYGSDQEMEKENVQYVSGWMFDSFGLRPAVGHFFTESDDGAPGAHPYAVLSYDYWTRRFGRDSKVVGQTFRMGTGIYEVIGVADPPFTGTETGMVTSIFLPMAMKNPGTLASPNHFWLRTFVLLKPDASAAAVQDKLRVVFRAIQEERSKGFAGLPRQLIESFLKERMILDSAVAGRSIYYNDLAQWHYHLLPQALGCDGWFTARVTTCAELDAALATAQSCGTGAYIEVVTDKYVAPSLAMKLHESTKTLYKSES